LFGASWGIGVGRKMIFEKGLWVLTPNLKSRGEELKDVIKMKISHPSFGLRNLSSPSQIIQEYHFTYVSMKAQSERDTFQMSFYD
jgi:hypothetical protein